MATAAAAKTSTWIDQFAGLSGLKPDIRDRLVSQSKIVTLREGSVIFGPGKAPTSLLLLLDGTVRVQQASEGGREVVLYRVEAGDSCVLTNACLLAYEDHAAEGIAETDTRAAAIPRAVFDNLVATSPEFRTFVFSAYSRRITDLFHVIDEIAFRRMDIRVAQKILDRAQNGFLKTTHAKLAAEIGTAREVISRQLAEFQRRGWIEQGRGRLTIIDHDSLSRLAAS